MLKDRKLPPRLAASVAQLVECLALYRRSRGSLLGAGYYFVTFFKVFFQKSSVN